MDTARVDFAFVTKMSLPSFMTFAFSGFRAVTIGLTTSRGTFRFEAVIVTCQILVVLLPAIQTHFFPTWSTSVVPEIVVPWFADDVAISSVV